MPEKLEQMNNWRGRRRSVRVRTRSPAKTLELHLKAKEEIHDPFMFGVMVERLVRVYVVEPVF